MKIGVVLIVCMYEEVFSNGNKVGLCSEKGRWREEEKSARKKAKWNMQKMMIQSG